MDANFRLKNQMVSNYSQDPGLGIGWAYLLPRAQYEEYVLSRANDGDVRIYFLTTHLLALDDSNARLDKHVCRSPGASEDEHEVFQRIAVYGCRRGDVWAVGNDHAFRHWEPAKGGAVRVYRNSCGIEN